MRSKPLAQCRPTEIPEGIGGNGPGPINAGNSNASWTNNYNGTGTMEIIVQDEYGNGIEDIELGDILLDLGGTEPEYLNDLDEDYWNPALIVHEGDGEYKVDMDRDNDELPFDQVTDVEVKDEVIHEDLEIEISGQANDGGVHNTTQDLWYDEIQPAIGGAGVDDNIKVYPGTYEEDVVIDVPNLTLQAVDVDGNVIDATEHTADPLVTVDADGEDHAIRTIAGEDGENLGLVTIEGFTVTNWSDGGIIGGGREGTRAHVLRNYVFTEIEGVRQPIQVSGDSSEVIGNKVEATRIDAEGWTATAILANDAKNTLIQDNIVLGEDADTGIAIGNYWDGEYSGVVTENNTIDNNRISGCEAGIMLQGTGGDIGDTIITNNEVKDNHWGIDIQTHSGDVGNLTIVGNEVEGNVVGLDFYDWGGEYEIAVDGIKDNIFSNNDIQVNDESHEEQIDLEAILGNNTFIPDSEIVDNQIVPE